MPRLLTRPLLVLVLCLGAFAARPCAAQGDALEELFGERNRKQRALPEDPDELVAELARRGRYQRALNVLDALASKAPLDQSQLLAKGRILLTVGRFDELGELVESGLAERPESDALWLLRARRAELSSQLDGAVMAYRKVIELNPRGIEGTEARVRLGFVLRDLGRLGEGQALWLSLVSSYERDENPDPSARELFMTGLACRGLDLCKEVKQQFSKPMYKYVQVMFDQALRLDRGDIELLCAYGEAFSDKFNFADARKLLARAVELNGAYPDARVALAEALLGSYELGFARFDQARRHLDADALGYGL